MSMTDEEKRAFGERMKAAREAKKNSTETIQPINEDPQISAKMAELELEIKRAREFNALMEAREREINQDREKVTGLVALSGKVATTTVVAHKSKAQKMKENLAEQEKIQIFVPLEGKEKPGTQLPVTLNGHRVNVPKGVYVKVPQQVAQIVMDSLNQTEASTNIPQRIDLMEQNKQEVLA